MSVFEQDIDAEHELNVHENVDEEYELHAHENTNNQNKQEIAANTGKANNNADQLLDSVNIQVDVVVGEVRISMRELAKLKLADILKLGQLDQLVKLKVDSHAFAEGILVDVGGVIGVKITNRTNHIPNFTES